MPEALGIVEGLDREVKQLKSELIKMCWFMRGGLTLDEAFGMSFDDRQIVADLVKENLETTKKSGLPFF